MGITDKHISEINQGLRSLYAIMAHSNSVEVETHVGRLLARELEPILRDDVIRNWELHKQVFWSKMYGPPLDDESWDLLHSVVGAMMNYRKAAGNSANESIRRDDLADAVRRYLASVGQQTDVMVDADFSDEMFQYDHKWLDARLLDERFNIPKSRLNVWRDRCPRLDDRPLRAKKVGGRWVYLFHDVQELANRRDNGV